MAAIFDMQMSQICILSGRNQAEIHMKIETLQLNLWAVDKLMCYSELKLAILVAILNMQMSQIYIFFRKTSSDRDMYEKVSSMQ